MGRLRKFFIFFGEGDNFFFRLLPHPHFVRETSNQHPHFFPRCSLDRSTPESRIMQVKEKHKYRKQNVIRVHLQGCCYVLKRPPTLPTSKDSHYNDKRFGNLQPSFRSLAFFLRSITVKSLALYEWTNGTEIFPRSANQVEYYKLSKCCSDSKQSFNQDIEI